MLALTLGLVIQSTPINVESPGIRLVNLIPKLASESRLGLSVVPYLENDVVAIRTMGRPWSEVKANLAKVLNATWEENDGRYILTQTSKQQKADLDARYACMKAKINRLKADLAPHYSPEAWSDREFGTWLARVTKPFTDEQDFKERVPEMVWQRRSEPSGRFLARLFNGIEPSILTKVGTSLEHHPFSDQSLALHAKLEAPTDQILTNLRSETELVRSVFGFEWKNGKPASSLRDATHWRLKLKELGEHSLFAEVSMLDTSGRVLTTVREFSNVAKYPEFEPLRGKSRLREFATSRLRASHDLDSSYNDGATAAEIESGNKERLKAIGLVGELCSRWSKAELEDPLGYLGGDDWRLYSEESAKPMIALLTDDGAGGAVAISSPRLSTGSFRADSDGWIIGMHRDPLWVRQNRVDRREMGKLFNTLATEWRTDRFGVDSTIRRIEIGAGVRRLRLDRMQPVLTLVSMLTENVGIRGLGVLFATLPRSSQDSLVRGQTLLVARQPEETRRTFLESFFFSDGLQELDPRIAAVAFPKVDEGMILSGNVTRTSGFEVVYPPRLGFEPGLRRNFLTFDELARWMAWGRLEPATEVAEATQENLNLFLYHQSSKNGGARMTETYVGKPVLKSAMMKVEALPSELRRRLVARGQELLRAKPDGN
ncbi:MAG: hypothetical protein WCK51_04395 [Armatimonadota bacterium]